MHTFTPQDAQLIANGIVYSGKATEVQSVSLVKGQVQARTPKGIIKMDFDRATEYRNYALKEQERLSRYHRVN